MPRYARPALRRMSGSGSSSGATCDTNDTALARSLLLTQNLISEPWALRHDPPYLHRKLEMTAVAAQYGCAKGASRGLHKPPD